MTQVEIVKKISDDICHSDKNIRTNNKKMLKKELSKLLIGIYKTGEVPTNKEISIRYKKAYNFMIIYYESKHNFLRYYLDLDFRGVSRKRKIVKYKRIDLANYPFEILRINGLSFSNSKVVDINRVVNHKYGQITRKKVKDILDIECVPDGFFRVLILLKSILKKSLIITQNDFAKFKKEIIGSHVKKGKSLYQPLINRYSGDIYVRLLNELNIEIKKQ